MPSRALRSTKKPTDPAMPRIAIVCDFLTDIGGAERTVAALAALYPEAPVFTLLHDAQRTKTLIDPARVRVAPIPGVPGFMKRPRWRRYLLTRFPRAVEAIDLAGYDIVISSAHSYAKGLITKPETLHISYCHSPTRYLWDWHHQYLDEQRLTGIKRRIVQKITSDLREWDLLASERVDRFLANSKHVQARIAKYYRRESAVIYPPVDLPNIPARNGHAGYFLIVSRLEPYKRIDLAIKAFARMKEFPLIVIGDGSQRQALEDEAPSNVEFLGKKDDATVQAYYQGARAFLFPGEDDFGITPVEAMAAGKPVIAFGRGGALETVVEGKTGTFFYEPTPKDLKEAVMRLVTMEASFDPQKIRKHAEQFSKRAFQRNIAAFVEAAWAEHQATLAGAGTPLP